jgi:hypothetical protein
VVVDLVAVVVYLGVVMAVSRSSVPVNNVAVVVDGGGCGLWSGIVVFVVGGVVGGVSDGCGVAVGGGDAGGDVCEVVGRRWGAGGWGRMVWVGVESVDLVAGCGGGVVGGVVSRLLGFRLPSVFLDALVRMFCPTICCFLIVILFYMG